VSTDGVEKYAQKRVMCEVSVQVDDLEARLADWHEEISVFGNGHEADFREAPSGLHYGTLIPQYTFITTMTICLANGCDETPDCDAELWWRISFRWCNNENITKRGLICVKKIYHNTIVLQPGPVCIRNI